jgi:hypothetical protein
MLKIVVALAAVVSLFPQRPVTLADLTVPADRLPAGCALKVIQPGRSEIISTTASGVRHVRFFAGTSSLQPPGITTNPWNGKDEGAVAWLRQSVDGYNVRLPDGPPVAGRQAAAMFLRLADGVESAYSATYTATYAYEPPHDFAVHAVQFAPGVESPRRFSYTSDATIIERGRIRVLFNGDRSPCSNAIATHLKSLPD